jgi:hypothetical protein
MSDGERSGRVYWSEEEYLALARALIGQVAEFANARTEHDLNALGLGMSLFKSTMEQALAPERRRDLRHLRGVRAPLVAAFGALRGERAMTPRKVAVAVSKPPAEPVHWTEREWEQFATKVAALQPELDRTTLAGLSLRALNAAGAAMGRRREFRALGLARKGLLPAFARLAAPARFQRAPAPAEPVLYVKPEAPAAEAEEAAAPEAGPDAAPGAPAADAKPNLWARITWSRDEWLVVAAELHRMFPAQNYPAREQLVGINSQDVAFAQRVLPLARQRRALKLVSMTQMRPQLQQAFRTLAAHLAADAAHAAEAAAAPAPPVAGAAPAPAAEAAPAAFPTYIPSEPGAAPDPYRAAFAPLVALLAGAVGDQVVDRLKPLITQLLAEALGAPAAGALGAGQATLAPASLAASAVAGPAPAPERRAAPRKPSVGVFTNRLDPWRQELPVAFPGIEFTVIDTPKKIDAIARCDKVVAMTRFVGHAGFDKAKRAGGERFVPCDGAMTELKRLIGLLVTSGALAAAA